jgi:hypothetical protein
MKIDNNDQYFKNYLRRGFRRSSRPHYNPLRLLQASNTTNGSPVATVATATSIFHRKFSDYSGVIK